MHLETILKNLPLARSSQKSNQLLFEDLSQPGNNEFLFFIKPELLIEDPSIKTRELLEMILKRIHVFSLKISSIRILDSSYLNKHGIIAQHYGVINQIASDAKHAISDAAKRQFEITFNESFEKAEVMGGLELLETYPCFSADSLDYLWQNLTFSKLSGGTYAMKINLDGKSIYLVNGFHGRQLEHFTKQGRSIIVFSLKGDIDWAKARRDFVGSTCPENAKEGSIRKTLLENSKKYGLKAVTPSWNGVHLSAGPIEGLIELIRYQSDFDNNMIKKPSDFSFGQQLINNFGDKKANWILENPEVDYNGKMVSLFDLTEEKNSLEALQMLKSVQ